jgi:6-pyruvoyltetrahydropterin/6-carboxytetrahydropterin synthase
VFELRIERVFCAAHAMIIGGRREATHGHNWRVRLFVAGPALDDDGLLADFHELEGRLDEVLAPFDTADLNGTPPFDAMNPSAENVARHIAGAMASRMPPGVHVARVAVTEAPGCEAIYIPAHENGPA